MLFRLLLCCLAPCIIQAQQQYADSGYLVYMLGSDTTMAGYYFIKGNEFEIKAVARPNVSMIKMKGTLNSKGEIQTADGYSYKPGAESQPLISYKLYVVDNTTMIDQKRGNDLSTQRFEGMGMTANGVGIAFRYFLPFWSRYAPKRVGDSIVSGHLTLGAVKKLTITRIAPDKLYAGSSVMGMVTLQLDKNGKVSFIDGIGSSWNVTGKLSSSLGQDLDQMALRYALEEQSGGIRNINRLDSVFASINNTSIRIYYSRPQVRGRTIFGSVVPWGRFWRTGANAATRMVIDQPVYFQGKELPAGSYSIFTMPSKNGWTLMFNSQATIWGTEYNPAFDVLRVPMQAGPSSQFTELMTIEVLPSTNGGVLNVIWENTKASVEFATKNNEATRFLVGVGPLNESTLRERY